MLDLNEPMPIIHPPAGPASEEGYGRGGAVENSDMGLHGGGKDSCNSKGHSDQTTARQEKDYER